MNVNFAQDKDWARESPVNVVEGSTVTFACTYWGAVTSPTAAVYRNNATVTSTVMPSGSHTASGAVATLKPATGLVGGARYVIAVTGTVAGDIHVKKIELIVSKDEGEQ
jgi:hypothetical protein